MIGLLDSDLTPQCQKGTSVPLFYFIVFKKQMLQAAKTDLFNPLVPKAHNSVSQYLLFLLQIQPVKVS